MRRRSALQCSMPVFICRRSHYPPQSVIGGVAHLLNFDGSDTMSACYYAQFVLNGGRPIAQSVPASEHR